MWWTKKNKPKPKPTRSDVWDELHKLGDNIDKMQSMVFDGKVTWAELESWPKGERRTIGDSVNEKIWHDDDCMVFHTELIKFPGHLHNFWEDNFIVSGKYKDQNGTYSVGDSVSYPPYDWHEIDREGDDPLKIIVVFTRKRKPKV